MPTGKVKWFDADKGFGFVSNPGHDDVHVGRTALPEGVTELVPGQRVEYDVATGLRGKAPEALRVTVLDQGPRRAAHKYTPEKLHGLVQDTVSLLENRVQPVLESGRRPGRKEGHQVAEILRTIARELDS
ncbi:cold-shock protein [Corynebacterium variabile]|uniref:cold-shock protein n=1 Tax=Corynebacterium variabile TaxID=1727 RepID=UPI001DFBA94C|nr:cold shock domain-containing protein [Corynebacterium variabile]HJG46535.1 cold shock domain-containing protein [Corynebacterium variabile]